MKTLSDFGAVYVTIGDTLYAMELIGLRKNTKFVGAGGKNKSKPINDNNIHLVVPFEKRKKGKKQSKKENRATKVKQKN